MNDAIFSMEKEVKNKRKRKKRKRKIIKTR